MCGLLNLFNNWENQNFIRKPLCDNDGSFAEYMESCNILQSTRPAPHMHNNSVIITSKRFDVITTLSLRRVPTGTVVFDGIEKPMPQHYGDVIMSEIASQITSLKIVYSTVYSDVDQRKHQSSTWLAFVREFPAQMAIYAENVSISWRHHAAFWNMAIAATTKQ